MARVENQPYVKVGRSQTIISIPTCLSSDAVETPLNSLLMEENKQTPTENQPKERAPEKHQRPVGTSKRKLDLQFEPLSSKEAKTPECKPGVVRKLQNYWEQKSCEKIPVKSLGTPLRNDKPVPMETSITKSPSITPPITPKKSGTDLVKEYVDVVMKATSPVKVSTNSPAQDSLQDNSDLEDSDIWVFTPGTPASYDQTDMGPPPVLPEVIRSSRKSRSTTRRSVPRSKSTGDICTSDSDYSADDLTPKRPLRSKSPGQPRRLMSTNPSVYSQLISPSSSIDDEYSPRIRHRSNQDTSVLSAQSGNISDSWSANSSIETTRDLQMNRKTSLDTINLADLSEIKPTDTTSTSIREFNDSTFLGDLTFDLRNMSSSLDQSDLNQTQSFTSPCLAENVKDLIHDIVCGFVNSDPSINTDPDETTDTSDNPYCEAQPLQPDQEASNSSPDLNNNNDDTPDLTVPDQILVTIPEGEAVTPNPDGVEPSIRISPLHIRLPTRPGSFKSTFTFDLDLTKSTETNPKPTELDPCHSPDLSCHESPIYPQINQSPGTVNRNHNWSPTLTGSTTDLPLGDIWQDTDVKPMVLRNRPNLKRPRQLQFQPQSACLEDFEPSPKQARTPVSSDQFTLLSQPTIQETTQANDLDTSFSSCDTCEDSYPDTEPGTPRSDSYYCYSPQCTPIHTKPTSRYPTAADYPSPLILSPYTRFSSPSYSSDEDSTPLVHTQIPYCGDWVSPAPHLTRLSCTWSDSEDSVESLDEMYSSYREDPLDLRTENKDSPSDTSPERDDECADTDQHDKGTNIRTNDTNQTCHQPCYPSYGPTIDPHVAVLSRNSSSYWTEYRAGYVTYTPTPSYEANQYALNCYNNSISEISPWAQPESYKTENRMRTACMYQRPLTETYILADSVFKSTVTVPTAPGQHPSTGSVPSGAQLNCPVSVNVNQPVTTTLPPHNLPSTTSLNNRPITPCVQFDDSASSPDAGYQSDEKRSSGIFGMMAQSIKKKLASKVWKYLDSPNTTDYDDFELLDSLKDIRPYIISGYLSSTYLISLVKRRDLLNDMFGDALDNNGDIHQWVIQSCRKNTAAIFARDLMFRVFTLRELNNFNISKLSKKKMAAIRKCVKEQFSTLTKWSWRSKCIPLIKSSVSTLFKHRVRQVQVFFLMHSM